MKTRLVLVVTAIVACVAALLATSVSAAPHRTSASNRRAAQSDAKLLLSRLQLPAGALSSPTEPTGDGGYLEPVPLLEGSSARVVVDAWWRVPGSPSALLAYIASHRPSGSKLNGHGAVYEGGAPIAQNVSFGWPAVPGVLAGRTLLVTVVALAGGGTGVLAQAQSNWIVPRPGGEKVASTVHEVDVASGPVNGSPTVDLTLTNVAKVRRLVSLINGLPIVQPAVYLCPALLLQGANVVTLSFRRHVGGPLLARATYVAYPHLAYDSGPCNPIDLRIAGRRQKPLIGGNFLRRVQRLLGVQLPG